jgi:hypothetical protein
LRESGVLIAEQKSANAFDKTLYYRIDYSKLDVESITPKLCNRKHQNEVITVNTETTKDYFEDFWKAYPKRVAKEDAIKAWNKIKMDESVLSKILDAIKVQDLAKQDKKFVPYPATWLNKKRWEDEVIVSAVPKKPYWMKGGQL